MSFMLRHFIVVLLLSVPFSAWAAHPFEVDDTTTQGKGNFLLELNGDYSKKDELKTITATGIVTVGASDHTDIALEVPYVMLDPSPATGIYEQGGGDLRLDLKYQLFENEVKQSMGFKIFMGFPTGNDHKGLGGNNYFTGFQIMDQQECGNNILHASVGYESIGEEITKWRFVDVYAFRFGLAAEHKFTESFRLLMEFAGENRRQADEVTGGLSHSLPLTFLAGFKYDISRSWYVDLAGRWGLNKYAEDYTALAGTAWRF